MSDKETIEHIKSVLEHKVAPSVAAHGGFINFVSFKDGHLKLEMAGSCSGCAMSQVTLKQGVESMMKHYVPEVMSIESQDDEKAQEKGYTPWA